MKFIKNTFFSLALICSCSLLPSAPAQKQVVHDPALSRVLQDVDVPELSLGEYQILITGEMAHIEDLCQKHPDIKELHEKLNQNIQSSVEKQYCKNWLLIRQQYGADHEELSLSQHQINEAEKKASAFLQQATQITNHMATSPYALEYYVCLKNIYLYKAGILQGGVNTQNTKIGQLTAQNKQQAAHISALQAELHQLKNPNEQQIVASGVCSQVGPGLRTWHTGIVLDSGNLNTDQK